MNWNEFNGIYSMEINVSWMECIHWIQCNGMKFYWNKKVFRSFKKHTFLHSISFDFANFSLRFFYLMFFYYFFHCDFRLIRFFHFISTFFLITFLFAFNGWAFGLHCITLLWIYSLLWIWIALEYNNMLVIQTFIRTASWCCGNTLSPRWYIER